MKKEGNALKVKAVMEYYGERQKQFAARTKVAPGNISDILKGKRTCGEAVSNKILIACPEINPDWFFGISSQMLNSSHENIINGDINISGGNNTNIGHGQRNMPAVIEIKENGVEMECPNCGEVIEVPGSTVLAMVPKEITKKPDIDLEKWRRKHPQQMKKIDFSQIWGEEPFVVQVDTRAMEPDYREGTFLVLQPLPDISYATADGIAYVIDTMKPHTLFRNLTDKYDGTYLLTSNNDKRSSIRLKAEDIITVYDIVGSFRIGR